MTEKTFATPCGEIHYWKGEGNDPSGFSLVFLPGLTADHRLFDRQIRYFEGRFPVLVWDAPEHAASWPFSGEFDLSDKARWLNGILEQEGMRNPVIIGQSMGGYVGQMYAQLYPGRLKGFISIDSAPLQREYVTDAEIWLLKRMEPVYRHYPWKALVRSGTRGVATTDYGRDLMRKIMMTYDGDQDRYAQISGHGFRMLAEAMEADLPYRIDCPALLICGDRDRAGSCIRYNRAWHNKTGIPIVWIKGAGHNSNTDRPRTVNILIEDFLKRAAREGKQSAPQIEAGTQVGTESLPQDSPKEETVKMSEKRACVIYYSNTGTTRAIAEKIRDAFRADMVFVEPEKKYGNFALSLAKVIVEKIRKSTPGFQTPVGDFSGYDVIFVGFPIWADTMPVFFREYLKSADLKGKRVIPFATAGKTGRETALQDLQDVLPDCEISDYGFFSVAGKEDPEAWLRGLSL